MKRRFSLVILTQAIVLGLGILATQPAAIAGSRGQAPLDLGAAAAATSFTISIVLKVRDADGLDDFIAASVNPQSPSYHRFLTVEQFRNRFAPPAWQIKQVTEYLQSLGIVVNEVYANNLVIKATGTASQFEQAFTTTMRKYRDARGREFHRPFGDLQIPDRLRDIVLYVAGLNTQASQFRPHSVHARAKAAGPGEASPRIVLPAGNSTATGVPGSFTTGDVANLYGVNPLYAKGITGQGRTIGIITVANFLPSDAYYYWSQIGLQVDQNRITQVHIDGGGDLSSDAGSAETSLDVQQSGGMAPGAKIIVYDAPNTEAGFIDLFFKAAADNVVDTLSVSWGSPEIYNFLIPGISSESTGALRAYHQALAEAAAQGISTFASSGDSGAYDTNSSAPYPNFSKILTVDSPASDPYIIAAGGTTLPGDIQRKFGIVNVPSEQVWGWDVFNAYLTTYYGPDCTATLGLPCNDYNFSVGGGGGVSVFWPRPDYQKGVKGIRNSEPNQVWTFSDLASPPSVQYLYTVPAHVKGRNLPDISLNSDPYTGYLIYSTTDGGWLASSGGTSFASPQLNGIFALISQAKSSRLGLLHPQLYGMRNDGWQRKASGVVDITAGDNWFYADSPGYEPGAGLGVINAAALVNALR